MDNDNEEELDYIDIFFINNKVRFKLNEMDIAVMAISYKKNNFYWIIVNFLYEDYKKELIDIMVDIISKSYYENKKLGIYSIKSTDM